MISAIAVTMALAMTDAPAPPAPPPPPRWNRYAPPPPRTIGAPPPILYAPPPPPPPPRAGGPARAKANLASLISDDDYPASALRAHEEGTTGFRLEVGPNGRVTGCTIIQSSGSAALDSATCRLLTFRARFVPARDAQGVTTWDSVRGRIIWRIPSIDLPWAPALFVEETRATPDGAVSCREGWHDEDLQEVSCGVDVSVRVAAQARLAGRALTQSIVTRLVPINLPPGTAEPPDRPDRGEPFLASEAVFTIGPNGAIAACRPVGSTWLGTPRRPGVAPSPCAEWSVGDKLYLPAPDAPAQRAVRVRVRGFIGPSPAPAPAPAASAAPPTVAPAFAPAFATAGLNWESCLEDGARRLALEAASKRAPMPDAEAVLAGCAEQEGKLRTALAADPRTTFSTWPGRRARALEQVRQRIADTWREQNFD